MPDLYLEGDVGAPFWPDAPHFTAAHVREALTGFGGQDVTVYLNSGGGIATDGMAVYHALNAYPGRVTVIVTGVAASAASLLAMASDDLVMLDGSVMMIHDAASCWIEGRGTEDEHRSLADSLGKLSHGYAGIYAQRAGISIEDARALMRSETWFTPEEAVAAGFADRVGEDSAQAAAEFTYAAYHHAPAALVAKSRAGGPSRRAVLAMISGGRPPARAQAKGTTMDPEDEDLTITVTEGEDDGEEMGEDTADGGDGTQTDAGDGTDDGEDTTPGAQAEDETLSDAAAICDLVTLHGGSAQDAADFLHRGMTVSTVLAHYRQKGNPVPTKPRGPQARITRDERDTRRAGMTAALAAQFGRTAPEDDRARPFMAMTLAEMAAHASGYRGPIRTANDRIEVFMNTHTTSDFPLALSSALNKVLADRYRTATPIYRQISREKSFKDFRAHSIVRAGDFPMLQAINEAGEIKFGTIGESAETVALVPYGVGFRITRQALINDDVGAIADGIADQGRMVARFEEKTFFATCFAASGNGPTLSNGRAVFNTTDKTKAASGGAISVSTISAGRSAIRKHVTLSGQPLDVAPKIILTSPDTETSAEQVVSPLVPADADKANPFSGKLTVLSTAQLTGNGWYLLPDPQDVPLFVYGYLEGASAPRMRMEETFGTQGMAWTVEHDFAVGPADRIGGWFNPGA